MKVVQKSDKECNNAQKSGTQSSEEKGSSNSHDHQQKQQKQPNKESDALPFQLQQSNLPRGKEELKKVHIHTPQNKEEFIFSIQFSQSRNYQSKDKANY